MGALDTALDTIFASELAQDAVYTPQGAAPIAIRAVPVAPDIETDLIHGTKLQQRTTVFDVRRSELAAPSKTATILCGDLAYRIIDFKTKDPRRAVWSIEAALQ